MLTVDVMAWHSEHTRSRLCLLFCWAVTITLHSFFHYKISRLVTPKYDCFIYNTDICKITRREPHPACVDIGACSYQRWPPCCLTVLHFVISDLYCTVAQLPHPCEIMQSYPDGSETLTLILTDFIWNYWALELFSSWTQNQFYLVWYCCFSVASNDGTITAL